MSDQVVVESEKRQAKKLPPNKRSDGAAGRPLIVIPDGGIATRANTAGAPNAALKEAPPNDQDQVNRDHPQAAHLRIVDADAGLIGTADGSPRRRKFAICGFASSTRQYMPVHDDSWEIWTLNQLYRHLPRSDVHFDIHYNWDQEVVPGTDHRGWIRDCGIPVYMKDRLADLPTSVRFPMDALLAYFQADYFTSTIAYMVALAIWEIDRSARTELRAFVRRTKKSVLADLDLAAVLHDIYGRHAIGIFGVDLVVGEEYFWQKACAEFWVGQACARGIQIVIPPESALCKQPYRYGYDPEPTDSIKLKEVEAQQLALGEQRNDLFKKLCMVEGALQNNDRWRQVVELRGRGSKI